MYSMFFIFLTKHLNLLFSSSAVVEETDGNEIKIPFR